MASIEGLTEEQCQALAGVQVGDILLIESYLEDDKSDDGSTGSGMKAETAQNERATRSGDEAGSNAVVGEVKGGTANEEGVIENQDAVVAEIAEVDDDDDGENENEDDDSDEDRDSNKDGISDQNVGATATAAVYKVHRLNKDGAGSITDITACVLEYCSKPGEAISAVYHIYGQDVAYSTASVESTEDFENKYLKQIKDVVNDNSTAECSITLKPTGEDIYSMVFHGRCPSRCNNGWVATQEEMHAMITDNIAVLSPHAPVCPVCIGKPLMEEQQSLRGTLDTSHAVDIGEVIEFYGRLNPRRRQLGYSFKQFDEREWGFMFDDIPSEEDEELARDHAQWGYWDEAMDPNFGATYQPASEMAIASVPRKLFSEVAETAEKSTACAVCLETFTDSAVVAELPCGHFFCNEGCAEQWLKLSNSCPTCRVRLTSNGSEHAQDTAATGLDVGRASSTPSKADDSGFDEANLPEIEKDGEDVVMSDAPA